MRILADTNIFVWYALNEPMDRRMVDSIQDEHTERFLSGDRLIAATALVEKVELWHTDRELKRLHRDFPARYFRRRESE